MAAATLPNFIVIKSYYQSNNGHAYYKSDNSVGLGEQDVFSTLVKVAVEQATSDSRYVHLRFVYNNGYWAKNTNDTFINVASKQPVEDIADPACTLFEPIAVAGVNQRFYLRHVQSGGRVRMNNNSTSFYVDVNAAAVDGYLTYVDWESLVKLPAHVAFKGDNDMYAKATVFNGASLLQFSSSNPNEKESGHRVSQMADGRVQITSDLYGQMWWSGEWSGAPGKTFVYGDWSNSWPAETALFTPIKIDGSTIALRSNGDIANGFFCARISEDARNDCLAPRAVTVTPEARLVVQELVQERTIYDAVYDMANARIYNVTPFVAGKAVVTNATDREATMAVGFAYQSEISYTFSRIVSLSAGVETTFQVGVPLVENSQIVISPDINAILQWGAATATTRSATVSGSVVVPAKSSAVVEYVGTTAACDVPFSYSQKDVLSTDGATVITNHTDGIYTGINSYNFNFQVVSTTPLDA